LLILRCLAACGGEVLGEVGEESAGVMVAWKALDLGGVLEVFRCIMRVLETPLMPVVLASLDGVRVRGAEVPWLP
jgi:hypothetical protein